MCVETQAETTANLNAVGKITVELLESETTRGTAKLTTTLRMKETKVTYE